MHLRMSMTCMRSRPAITSQRCLLPSHCRSCRIQDNCIVGARSVLLEGSLMETNSILEPGSVLPPARRIPSGELWGGSPARFIRKLTADEVRPTAAPRAALSIVFALQCSLPVSVGFQRVHAACLVASAVACGGAYTAAADRCALTVRVQKADIKAVAQDVYNIAAEHWANDLPHGTAWRDVEAWRAERIKRGELAWGNARAMRYYARKEAEEAHKLSQVR